MEKEGAALADRPLSIAAGETLSGGMRTLLVGEGPQLKKLRRALHARLQEKVASDYEPIQLDNAKNVVLDILKAPKHHQDHGKRYAASVIMSLTYGKTTPTSYFDPEVQKVNLCLARLGAAARLGAYLVDSFPILKYFPGYLSQLKAFHREELDLFRSQLDAVRAKMGRGEDVQPCFAKYLIENQTQYDLSDNETAYLAGSMFGAGSDTTAAAISIVIMAAATHPDTQIKVQEELDRVIGLERYPTFADQASLPFTTAFFLETYRWSIFRDPEVFPNPDIFDPQRWISDKGRIREDMKNFNFGFGRRVCVGHHVANRSVFINTALILWAFRISEDRSSPIDTMALTNSANVHPLPFKVNFEPRQDPRNIKRLFDGN
ncbi:hypothetical protein VKT23_015860 [Stygiomarasmius scandens]|uniref:Cytochrome P450 n=1 Tax=Marasmiellus scandens TaxID=2682957 RepID=A0ABR1IWX8_9AGAR